MSQIFTDILNWLIALFGGNTDGTGTGHEQRQFPTKISEMFGWGESYNWMKCESEWVKWADALEAAGCNLVPIEVFGLGEENHIGNATDVLTKLPKLIDIMAARGIVVHVIIFNWNVGAESGWGKSICNYPESYLKGLIDKIIAICQGHQVIMEPCTEWSSSGRNNRCYRTAQSLCNYLASKWPGWKAWNAGSRPGSSPAGWINNWHVNEIGKLGPKNQLITTDTTMILNWLGGRGNYMGNHDRLTALVKASKKNGCGFSGYTCVVPGIDYEAIRVIGEAWNTP